MSEGAPRLHVKRQSRRASRSRRQKEVSRNLQYLASRVGNALFSRLPLWLGRALGWVAGTATYYLLGHERRLCLANLTRVYGAERSPREIRLLARCVFRHSAIVILEWIILRRWPREKLLAAFPEVAAGLRELEADVKASGSGVVGVTAHFGNWEVLSLIVSHASPGFLVPIAKPVKLQKMQDFLHRLRTESGNSVVYTTESVRKLIRAVRAGKLLGFLPDQDLRSNSGIFVDFFDKPAYTVTLPVALARKLQVPMLACYLLREGKGFRLVYIKPWNVQRSNDEASDLERDTQVWNRILEEEIRKHPAQWVWFYARWRSPQERPRRHESRHKYRRRYRMQGAQPEQPFNRVESPS